MSRSSQPTRLPVEIYEAAVEAASTSSRTVPQQIAHWASIGRELERSPRVSHRDVVQVLAGKAPYDGLAEPEQALVRAEWARRIAARRHDLDYATGFELVGESYSEADEDGSVIVTTIDD